MATTAILMAIASAAVGAGAGAAKAAAPPVAPGGGGGGGTAGGVSSGIGNLLGGVLGQIGQERSTAAPTDAGMGPTFAQAFPGPTGSQPTQQMGIMDRIQKIIDARKAALGGFLGGG